MSYRRWWCDVYTHCEPVTGLFWNTLTTLNESFTGAVMASGEVLYISIFCLIDFAANNDLNRSYLEQTWLCHNTFVVMLNLRSKIASHEADLI